MRSANERTRVQMTGAGARLGLVFMLLVLVPMVAQAQTTTVDYGWEDGGTMLGSYGNLTNASNVASGMDGSTPVTPNAGSAMLQVTESPHSGTPQAYVAFIENLTDGEIVTASFWGWDSTPGASPSLRIWAHYALSGDINSYQGSAGGNSTYTDGTGWDQVDHTWTFDSAGGTRDALVIEARLYSTPSTGDYSTDFWIDDLQVTAPETALVNTPTAVELASFSATPQGSIILLEWETAMELDNLGFNLHRASSPLGARVQLNARLIPSQNPGGFLGAFYEFVDDGVQPGTIYYYWLKDVDAYGATTLHGPVAASIPPYLRRLPARRRPQPGLPVLVGD